MNIKPLRLWIDSIECIWRWREGMKETVRKWSNWDRQTTQKWILIYLNKNSSFHHQIYEKRRLPWKDGKSASSRPLNNFDFFLKNHAFNLLPFFISLFFLIDLLLVCLVYNYNGWHSWSSLSLFERGAVTTNLYISSFSILGFVLISSLHHHLFFLPSSKMHLSLNNLFGLLEKSLNHPNGEEWRTDRQKNQWRRRFIYFPEHKRCHLLSKIANFNINIKSFGMVRCFPFNNFFLTKKVIKC